MLKFHNTLTGTTDEFSPIETGRVLMYNCGPTVYGRQHIGNLSMFVFTDVLRRTLENGGYNVRQVINFTDFGHLTSDQDEGEDKMTKGLKAEGLEPSLENMKILATKYAGIFMEDIKALNVEYENIAFPYASEYVPQQLDLVERLMEKGFGYVGKEGVYFDTSKFPDYGKLGNINIEGLKEGARIGLVSEKKNPTDFLLWKYSDMGWDSPGGRGFPGWHIECTAMIFALLGEQIDIHTGGIEHIPVHHNNEIAQAEAASGKKPFSKFWLHRSHLQLDGQKIAKSDGNVVYLSDIIERDFSPIAFRYLLLQSHYRTPSNFTWEALAAAQTAWEKLNRTKRELNKLIHEGGGSIHAEALSPRAWDHKVKFTESIEDDLNTPQALAVLWEVVKDKELPDLEKRHLIYNFDKVLGLNLDQAVAEIEIPAEVSALLTERETARANKDFPKSDELRDKIKEFGFEVKDSPTGQEVKKI